ncbi:MAG: trehalose-phosphatase [Pseudorhodoplanes sp.]|nr:trehalose-phosphatase [Pseudorhodoplanes sp.]
MLDVDGTLLDIAPRPQDVVVPEGLRDTLTHLACLFHGAVAFVSGRPIADIDRLFAPLRLAAAGGHGAEVRSTAGGATRQYVPALDPVLKRQFARIAMLGNGIIVEDKDYSLALHYRLAPELGGAVMNAVVDLSERAGAGMLEILPGKSVIEIKPRGFDKGSGLRHLMAHPPFAGRKPVLVGDDITDHAAFKALPEFDGVGFSVGGHIPGTSFNFDGPKHVRRWLAHLARDDSGALR